MAEKRKKKKTTFEERLRSFGSLLMTLVVVLFIQSFFIQGYSTPTGSMLNTILIGDKMFFNQFVYGGSTPRFIPFTEIKLPYIQLPAIREPRRNDVVNFEFPGFRDELEPSTKVQYLKRIVGEPGDVIEVKDKVLFVNGQEFLRPPNMQYVDRNIYPKGRPDSEIFPKGSGWNRDNYGPLTVPKKGDAVTLSKENYLQWDTFIKREGHKIEMKPDGKIFIDGQESTSYTVERNYYFMMGDNRDNSLDSRFWGFVPRENVVGKAWFVYFYWNSEIPFSRFGDLLASIRLDRIGKAIK
ncbi:MAG: signal peptidase I [Chlorobi bacterium]|nr:signal peptidase I [Chlorobiota bacterium]MCI0717012.1 signal peptidase I [Chlorobiota bacterium]